MDSLRSQTIVQIKDSQPSASQEIGLETVHVQHRSQSGHQIVTDPIRQGAEQ